MCPCVIMYKVCEHNILQATCGNFAKLTTEVQLRTKMNWLDIEVKRSKVKMRPNMAT